MDEEGAEIDPFKKTYDDDGPKVQDDSEAEKVGKPPGYQSEDEKDKKVDDDRETFQKKLLEGERKAEGPADPLRPFRRTKAVKDDSEANHPDFRPSDNIKAPRAYGQYVLRQKTERQAKLDKAAEEERLASLNKKDVIEAAKQAERLLESQKAASKEKAELSELMRAKNDEENRVI